VLILFSLFDFVLAGHVSQIRSVMAGIKLKPPPWATKSVALLANEKLRESLKIVDAYKCHALVLLASLGVLL
jgi:hypothetical protein